MTSTAVATPKIVGKALYLELIADETIPEETRRALLGWQHNGTKQIIVFPQYQDDSGNVHEAVVMSRLVSSHSPRSQWDMTWVRTFPKPNVELEEGGYSGYTTIPTYSRDEWKEATEREKYEARKLGLAYTLRKEMIDTRNEYSGEGDEQVRTTVAQQGWIVREGKPISVEITDQDCHDVFVERKTPQAVIRRINKVRGTLDKFPAKLA
jgi:hypothetical protein